MNLAKELKTLTDLSDSDLEMLHEALSQQRTAATSEGRIWSRHDQNASLRTKIETAFQK